MEFDNWKQDRKTIMQVMKFMSFFVGGLWLGELGELATIFLVSRAVLIYIFIDRL